jgi:hypothetical protein
VTVRIAPKIGNSKSGDFGLFDAKKHHILPTIAFRGSKP